MKGGELTPSLRNLALDSALRNPQNTNRRRAADVVRKSKQMLRWTGQTNRSRMSAMSRFQSSPKCARR